MHAERLHHPKHHFPLEDIREDLSVETTATIALRHGGGELEPGPFGLHAPICSIINHRDFRL